MANPIIYNPANPFNLNPDGTPMAGTGNFAGVAGGAEAALKTAQGAIPATPAPAPTPQSQGGQPQTLNISTGNPALKTLFDSANQLLNTYTSQGGQITPEIQQRIQAINDAELQKQGAVAGARTAADNKNAPVLDSNLQTANTATTTQQTELQSLLTELKTARESYIGSLTPTQAEQDLRTRLNTLRTERQLLPLELRQEGISAPGIAGRQVEDERVRAIQEQNLLLELGLKQEARQYETTAKEKQVGFIKDDITLQQSIQEKLQAREDKVLEQARNLSKDSLSALSSVADRFKGLAWTDLDPQTQIDVTNLLKQYPDLTPQILADTLSIAKKQQVFDNAIKQQNAKQQNAKNNAITGGSYASIAQEAIDAGATPQQALNEAIDMASARGNTMTISDQNALYAQIIKMKQSPTSSVPTPTVQTPQSTPIKTNPTVPAPTKQSPLTGIGRLNLPSFDIFKKLFGQ